MEFTTIISTDASTLKIATSFLSDEKLATLFENCQTLELIKNPKIKVFGKEATMHRSVGFFSDESEGYKYSGQMAQSQPLPKFLKRLLKRVNKMFDTDFNGILVNRYEDGSDSIGAHSDDEKGLGKPCNPLGKRSNPLGKGGSVVGISLGAERVMRFRGKKTPLTVGDKKFLDMSMPHGCLFIMDGDFQKEFTHEVPVKKSVTEMRISLTFRKHTS